MPNFPTCIFIGFVSMTLYHSIRFNTSHFIQWRCGPLKNLFFESFEYQLYFLLASGENVSKSKIASRTGSFPWSSLVSGTVLPYLYKYLIIKYLRLVRRCFSKNLWITRRLRNIPFDQERCSSYRFLPTTVRHIFDAAFVSARSGASLKIAFMSFTSYSKRFWKSRLLEYFM